MSKPFVRLGAASLLAFAAASASAADPINLSTWTPLTLNFPGGQNAGSWVLEPGNTAVQQVINADPSFYLNNLNQTKFSIDGTWQVPSAAGDDELHGLRVRLPEPSNFYAFEWSRAARATSGRAGDAARADDQKFTGATGNGLTDLSLPEFWGTRSASAT